MDIRSFFGAKPGAAKSSDSTAKNASSSAKPSKKVVSPKRRSSKKSDDQDFIDEISDGEDPIPKELRKEMKKPKRTRVVLSSDSDDEVESSSKTKHSREKTKTPSPAKQPTKKKQRVVVESDSDYTPIKTSAKKNKNEDVVMLSESEEDELVLGEVMKKGKKCIPKGQKKLDFSKSEASSKPAEKKTRASEVAHVNPEDFFKTSAPKRTKPQDDKIPKTKTPMKAETAKTSPKKISPSAKENKDDEFVDSDDSFESFVSKPKKAKNVTPVKKDSKKSEERKERQKAEKKLDTPPKKTVEKVKTPVKAKEEKSQKPVVQKPKPSMASTVQHTPPAPKVVDPSTMPWVEKYKPKSVAQLVGQHGDKSPMNKLLDWLKDWAKHNLGEGAKIKKPKPAPWAAQQDGKPFKAALLSGGPGVGKTTCAYMACEVLGFNLVEMNASDVRSKKHLEAKVAQLSGSHQIEEFFGKKPAQSQDNLQVHHVLIMDEVDGMSGNEDRAGIAELIQIIKESKIPIICICNDRMHPKIRSLANYCYDLRFHKPRIEQIRPRLMTIAAQEKVKISKEELDQLIEISGQDVRQTIYNLQMRSNSNGDCGKKDVTLGPFEAARKLLDTRSTLREKNEMFFVDYGIMPLFVQENYLNMRNDKHTALQAIRGIRKAADFISLGDVVERNIRGGGNWKLLNEQSMLSCALPAIATDGHLRAMLQFPSWLGKNSTAGKRRRLLNQLVMHTHLRVSAGTYSFATDYAPILRQRLTKPLLEKEGEGVAEVIETMDEYDLVKDDGEALAEIAVWPGKIDPASKILSKVKSALTRQLNKEHRMLPYSIDEIGKGKRRGGAAIGIEMDEEGNLVEQFEDDDDADEEAEDVGGNEVVVKKVEAKKGGASSSRGGRGGAARGRGRGAKK